MDFVKNPSEIENKSFEIIKPYLDGKNLTENEILVYSRTIHASGDVGYADLVRTSEGAIEKGIEALMNGADIYSDVNMVITGINQSALDITGGKKYCLVNDPQIFEFAKKENITRSMAAIRFFGERLNGQIVAIGNAPTALYEVIRLCKEENIKPALIVGIPVGFVGAAESKDYLIEEAPAPYVTVVGNKGGSTIAASVVNAMLYTIVKRDKMLFIKKD